MNKMKKNDVKTLPKIRANKALERYYRKRLEAFSSDVNDSFKWWVIAKFSKNNFNPNSKIIQKEFKRLLTYWRNKSDEFSGALANKIVSQIVKFVNNRYKKAGFKSIEFNREIKNILNSHIIQNKNLIKSIPEDVMLRYNSTFLNSIGNLDREDLENQAKTIAGISHRRARTIARDQTHKAINDYISARSKSLGLEYYQWLTSDDERVSRGYGGHRQLNNRIYRYDEATAIVDSYGNKGKPGDRVNCRCIPVSVFLEPNQKLELVKDIISGDYYKIIDI